MIDCGNAEIVFGQTAGQTEHFAAEELQYFMQAMTGKRVPLSHHAGGAGFRLELETLAKPDDAIRFDGFRWSVSPDSLKITANLPRGVLNGVYTLLNFWGCRWFFYKDEPVIPHWDRLPLPNPDVVNPDLELRGVCIFSVMPENVEEIRTIIGWLAKNRFNLFLTSVSRSRRRKNNWIVEWGQVEKELLPELQKRGMILDISEHSGRWFFPVSYFEDHPEWFAMNAEGKRFCKGQICYSNPEAVEVLARNYAQYVKEHSEVDIIGPWPEDGYGFCHCRECAKPGTVLKAVNRIADAVAQVRPDVTVEYLAYTQETSQVPDDVLPRKNMAVLVANINTAKAWKEKTDAAGGRGVYRLHYHITDNTAERANLPLRFQATLDDCRETLALGVRGIIPFFIGTDTWWRSSLNLYFLTRFSWNVHLEVHAVLGDFCRKWFPSAADRMEELFLRLEKMPMVMQHRPPRWPLWQHWDTLKTDFSGVAYEKTESIFAELLSLLEKTEKASAEDASRFLPIRAYIDFQRRFFMAWHYRALAVEEFERNNPSGVRQNLLKTAEYERDLADQVRNSAGGPGIAGAWVDYEFFLNWRLQLDKQLLEMRTEENMIPVTDENPDMELFLPGLLNS